MHVPCTVAENTFLSAISLPIHEGDTSRFLRIEVACHEYAEKNWELAADCHVGDAMLKHTTSWSRSHRHSKSIESLWKDLNQKSVMRAV